MRGVMRQSWYDSQQSTSYGNATIAVASTGNSRVYSNTTNNSTYLTFMVPFTQTGTTDYQIIYANSTVGGSFTVSGNTALIDILLVGPGGNPGIASFGGGQGGSGGTVNFYSNVKVNTGTYNVYVGAYTATNGKGTTTVLLSPYTLTANPGNDGSATTTATGGDGAGANHVGGVGGVGRAVALDPMPWLLPSGNNIPYFGGGGGGANNVNGGDNISYAGGYSGGAAGVNPEGTISPAYAHDGTPGSGGGAGAGPDGGFNSYYGTGGSGVVVIRHRSS